MSLGAQWFNFADALNYLDEAQAEKL